MSLFASDNKGENSDPKGIPKEFFDAVTTMNDDDSKSDHVSTHGFAAPKTEGDIVINTSVDEGKRSAESSPFLNESEPVSGKKSEVPVTQPVSEKELSKETPREKMADSKEKSVSPASGSSGKSGLLLAGIIVLTLGIIGGGIAYYYLLIKEKEAVVTETPSVPTETETGTEPNDAPLPLFSVDKPNYLSINTETATPEDITAHVNQVFQKMSEGSIAAPVEFLITDQNNNPIAFSRFAYLSKLELSSELMSEIDEAFSLYVYSDAGNMRLGMAITVKDPATMAQLLQKEEAALPYEWREILYPKDISVPSSVTFRSGDFNGETIRYANIETEKAYSFDYNQRGRTWFIGSSKDTLRAILSKSK